MAQNAASPLILPSGLTPSLDRLRAAVSDDLEKFRSFFREAMRSDERALDMVLQYVLKTKGKELRPLLVFYAAHLVGDATEDSFTAAAMVELLHTATLIHDDVIDEADQRRGFATINKIWKNKAGVLVGDYLLSRGLLISLQAKRYDMLHTLSDAVKRMSEAEIAQLKASKLLDINREKYFAIISGKTASLLSTCCAAGALSAKDSTETDRIALAEFGENLGIAFQIRDDLFDYESFDTGKSAGTDIKERKITLPLLEALASADTRTSRKLFKMVRKKDKSAAEVQEIIAYVKKHKGDEQARNEMIRYAELAIQALEPYKNRPFYPRFIELTSFVIHRTK